MLQTESPPPTSKRLKPLRAAPGDGLVLHEIYASIQGESTWAGMPCTFVRTTACHLRCGYCDTPHAFAHGKPWQLDAVLDEVARLGVPLVEVTGGEPLLQANVLPLMTRLCEAGHTVLLETSGSLDISVVDPRVIRIMDLKAPSSGECDANRLSNIDALVSRDEVKFVLADENDYAWACEMVRRYDLAARCTVLFGTVYSTLPLKDLAHWIMRDKLPVRMQLQWHKVIWEPEARGV